MKGLTKPGTKEYGRRDHTVAQREKPARIARRQNLSASDRRGFKEKETSKHGYESG